MKERYTFCFAYQKTDIVQLICRVDASDDNHRTLRSWYCYLNDNFAGIDLTTFCGNYPDPAQAALHFGLHLIDRDWIDCLSLFNIQYRPDQWLHISECEEMGNVGIMTELDCKIYPVTTYVVERCDPYAGN